MCIAFIHCWTNVSSTLVQHCINVIQMFCVCREHSGDWTCSNVTAKQICLNVTDEFVYNMYNIQPHSRDYPVSMEELALSWLWFHTRRFPSPRGRPNITHTLIGSTSRVCWDHAVSDLKNIYINLFASWLLSWYHLTYLVIVHRSLISSYQLWLRSQK